MFICWFEFPEKLLELQTLWLKIYIAVFRNCFAKNLCKYISRPDSNLICMNTLLFPLLLFYNAISLQHLKQWQLLRLTALVCLTAGGACVFPKTACTRAESSTGDWPIVVDAFIVASRRAVTECADFPAVCARSCWVSTLFCHCVCADKMHLFYIAGFLMLLLCTITSLVAVICMSVVLSLAALDRLYFPTTLLILFTLSIRFH